MISCLVVGPAGQQGNASARTRTFSDPFFGIRIDIPEDWYHEADNPWQHTHVSPWHLPLIPIKELQPTAVDILPEKRKTLVVHFEPLDETSDHIRVSVEKMPFGTSLDGYAEHVLARIQRNNDNVKVEEMQFTTLSGNPAIRLVTTTSTATETYSFSARTMQVMTLYGDLAYTIEYHGNLEYYDVHRAHAEHAVRTVSIIPPTSYAQLLSVPLLAGMIGIGSVLAVTGRKEDSRTRRFLSGMRRALPAAFGIEVLCIASAEVGGLVALYVYGFNSVGIVMAYVLAYGLAGFTTFVSILGKSFSDNESRNGSVICSCMDISHGVSRRAHIELAVGLRQTFSNFGRGLSILPRISRLPNSRAVIKASLLILLSAESGCIIAAATVDVMLYQYSIFLSIPIALLAGTITVACLASYRSMKQHQLLSHKHAARGQ